MKAYLNQISQHEVFEQLSESQLEELSAIMALVDYAKDEVVYDHNQQANKLYFISEGSFLLVRSDSEEHILVKGQLIGEVGLINGDFRHGKVTALEPSKAVSICGRQLFEPEVIHPSIALKVITALSKRITNYLRSKNQVSTKEILSQGENHNVEFKSSLRWNLHTNKKDPAIEHAVIKSLAAFMNTYGGVLMVGVNDDGKPVGLDHERLENHDKILLHLNGLIKSRIGTLFTEFALPSIETIDGKDVLRIDCKQASKPAFVNDKNDEFFYIRTGPATTALKVSKALAYIREHFPKSF